MKIHKYILYINICILYTKIYIKFIAIFDTVFWVRKIHICLSLVKSNYI